MEKYLGVSRVLVGALIGFCVMITLQSTGLVEAPVTAAFKAPAVSADGEALTGDAAAVFEFLWTTGIELILSVVSAVWMLIWAGGKALVDLIATLFARLSGDEPSPLTIEDERAAELYRYAKEGNGLLVRSMCTVIHGKDFLSKTEPKS